MGSVQKYLFVIVSLNILFFSNVHGQSLSQLRQDRERAISKQESLYEEVLFLALEYPRATAGVLASGTWASDIILDHLEDDMGDIVAIMGIVGAAFCVWNKQNRQNCAKVAVELGSIAVELDNLDTEIARLNGLIRRSSSSSSSSSSSGSSFSQTTSDLKIHNKCNRSVRILLRFLDQSGSWKTVGWWSYDANERLYPMHSNQRIRLQSPFIYYYAEYTNGAGQWRGSYNFSYGGQSWGMRQKNLDTVGEDAYTLTLTC